MIVKLLFIGIIIAKVDLATQAGEQVAKKNDKEEEIEEARFKLATWQRLYQNVYIKNMSISNVVILDSLREMIECEEFGILPESCKSIVIDWLRDHRSRFRRYSRMNFELTSSSTSLRKVHSPSVNLNRILSQNVNGCDSKYLAVIEDIKSNFGNSAITKLISRFQLSFKSFCIQQYRKMINLNMKLLGDHLIKHLSVALTNLKWSSTCNFLKNCLNAPPESADRFIAYLISYFVATDQSFMHEEDLDEKDIESEIVDTHRSELMEPSRELCHLAGPISEEYKRFRREWSNIGLRREQSLESAIELIDLSCALGSFSLQPISHLTVIRLKDYIAKTRVTKLAKLT